jgi:hypothetical protein
MPDIRKVSPHFSHDAVERAPVWAAAVRSVLYQGTTLVVPLDGTHCRL